MKMQKNSHLIIATVCLLITIILNSCSIENVIKTFNKSLVGKWTRTYKNTNQQQITESFVFTATGSVDYNSSNAGDKSSKPKTGQFIVYANNTLKLKQKYYLLVLDYKDNEEQHFYMNINQATKELYLTDPDAIKDKAFIFKKNQEAVALEAKK